MRDLCKVVQASAIANSGALTDQVSELPKDRTLDNRLGPGRGRGPVSDSVRIKRIDTPNCRPGGGPLAAECSTSRA